MKSNTHSTPAPAGAPSGRPLSAAMRRHVCDDSENELYTRFRYSPVTGLGFEKGVSRRDPSSIIRVGDLYYVWYTHCLDMEYTWLNADLWYATSPDGVAVADHPEGPYVKSPLNPVTNSGHEIWTWPWKSGIAAIVDWAGPEKNTVQYTADGVNFEIMAGLEDIPPAGGAYIPDKFDDPENGQGFSWGLCHYGRSDWTFLVRFDCDLRQGMPKQLSWDQFPHYSTIRDVMRDPERFAVPREAWNTAGSSRGANTPPYNSSARST